MLSSFMSWSHFAYLLITTVLTILSWIGLGRIGPTKNVIFILWRKQVIVCFMFVLLAKSFLVTCLYLNFYLLHHTRFRLCKTQVLWQKTCTSQQNTISLLLMKELRISQQQTTVVNHLSRSRCQVHITNYYRNRDKWYGTCILKRKHFKPSHGFLVFYEVWLMIVKCKTCVRGRSF